MVPEALELGEYRGGKGEDFTTPAPGAKWLGFQRHLVHVPRTDCPQSQQVELRLLLYCTPRYIFGMP